MGIKPFKINFPDQQLDDLKLRLVNTRWPEQITDSEWDYGTNLSYMKELSDYWLNDFEWRKQEQLLNSFDQYIATIDGVNIHFIHVRGKGPNPTPLIISHGWPGSIWEMYKIIPLLTDPGSHGGDPADSFDVVIPSIPGFGFSSQPDQRGMSFSKVGDLYYKLMIDVLGYDNFGAHGGDWGGGITARLGLAYPDNIIGLHVTLLVPAPYLGLGAKALTEQETLFLNTRDLWREKEGGYSHIQSTKPQTLSYGLMDSPVGLAAWIVEKFRTWSDCGGNIEDTYTKDELLTNITLYWLTRSINSSMRLYFESRQDPLILKKGEFIQPPTCVAIFPKDILCPPREWAERIFANLQRWNVMPSGGHFPALEVPELLVKDIRAFFRNKRM
tara:strand:+ start:19782 stop:20936 length:1155 start_codon:yes stop_codon:yes gene_type:complete